MIRWRIRGLWLVVPALLWAAYLLSANHIAILLLRDPGDVVPTRRALSGRSGADLTLGVDYVEVFGKSFLDKTAIRGWVALEGAASTTSADAACRIILVFTSDLAVYEAIAHRKPCLRHTITSGATNAGFSAGFTAMVIPVNMRAGSYCLGVLLDDGANNVSFGWTDRRFVQDRRGWREE